MNAVIIIFILLIMIMVWLWGFYGLIKIRLDTKWKSGQIKVACVGDSITYGMLVKNWYLRSYPKQLGNLLGDGYNVRNFGVSRRTAMATGDLPYEKEKRYRESLAYQPDIVFFMFGTNDSKPVNWKGKEEFKKQYGKLLNGYLSLDSRPVIYLLTPATPHYVKGKTEGSMEYGIRKPEILEACEAVCEIGREKNLTLIDINNQTKEHPEWFVFDGIHPNASGAAKIAEIVYENMKI